MKKPATAVIVLMVTATAALADDEIQIYNAQFAEVGPWTVQQHLACPFRHCLDFFPKVVGDFCEQ